MEHHEIDLGGFQEWLAEKEVDFASSTRERKRLTVALNGNIRVSVAGRTVYLGLQPYSAVEAYNSITEEFKA